MAYRSLRTLLAAAGLTPTSGMSFLTNVPGAVSGALMTDYKLYDWINWASSDLAGTHNDGDLIHFTFDFQAQNRWTNIRIASPTGMGIGTDISDDPAGRDALISSGTWNPGLAAGQSLVVQVKGRRLYGTYSGGSGTTTIVRNYYKFYDPPDYPLGSADEEWEIIASPNVGTYSPPSITSDTFNIIISYPATAIAAGLGSFNDGLTHLASVTVNGVDSGPSFSDTPQVEWHANSSFTSLLSTNTNYSFMVGSSNSAGDVWMRSRFHPTDSWTNYTSNPIHWHDVRY